MGPREKEIIEGVRVIPLPGHTPGSIDAVVDTEDGPYVITRGAVLKYGNLEEAPQEYFPYLMSGIYTDMLTMWKSFELIDEIVGGGYFKAIPGHDSLVFRKDDVLKVQKGDKAYIQAEDDILGD